MLTKYLFRFIYLSVIILLCSSCDNDPDPIKNKYTGAFILNEGNFMQGNASISVYDPSTNQLQNDIFNRTNLRPLGDVVQSMTFINNNAYIVVNNSQKIEVVDAETFESISTITDLISPRYLYKVSNDKAYITDLYGNYINVLNINSNKIVNTIPIQGWTEKGLVYKGNFYVTNSPKEYIYKIDISTDKIVDSIKVGYGSIGLVLDKYDHLWVLNSGINDSLNQIYEKATLNEIDISAGKEVMKKIEIGNFSYNFNHLNINKSGDTLYYLNNNIYQFPINQNSNPSEPFISGNYYSLSINPQNDQIYYSDAKDFLQKGSVFISNPKKELLHKFEAGIAPGNIVFRDYN